MPSFQIARENMVDNQIRTNKVTDPRLVNALRNVERHLFVPANRRSLAYSDEPLPVGEGRVLPSPMIAARLYQLANIGDGDLVLVVGSATGYGAAVLGRVASAVVALEADEDLAKFAKEAFEGEASEAGIGDNVFLVNGPLTKGWPDQAPYDVIVIEGAVEQVPAELIDQLAENGRLVTVLREPGQPGRGVSYMKTDHGVGMVPAFDAYLPILPGFSRAREFAL
jgi:protein-L-isoaspartate(D-aspartate) O-methyltransferase